MFLGVRSLAIVLLLGSCFVSKVRGQDGLPKVLILATGGTIANPQEGYVSGERLAREVPGLDHYAAIEVEDFSRIPSSEVAPEFWLKLSRRVNEILEKRSDLSGIVITHGSNTLAETAYFLNLTVLSRRPVVLTAAQRRLATLSSDGPKNLIDAVRVAADPAAAGRGVLVVVNEEINAAREVTKTLSFRLETYQTRDLGNLGYVDSDRVVFYRSVERRHTHLSEFRVSTSTQLARVEIVYAAAGINGEIVQAVAEKKEVRGIIVAAFPTGDVFPHMEAELLKAAESGIYIVLTNRGGVGRIPEPRAAKHSHWVSGDNLTPQKARVLLMLALSQERKPEEIERIFREY